MAKSKSAERAAEPGARPEAPSPPNVQFLGVVADAIQNGARVWLDCQEELARFVAARVASDFKAQQALVSCHDLGELAAIQQDWAAAAARDYFEEMTRLSRIPGTLVRDITTPHQPPTSGARQAAE